VIEFAVLAALSAVVGVAWGFVASAFPHADPAHAASQRLNAEAAEHFDMRRFLRARVDPATVTGLALTLALIGVVVVLAAFGVLVAMIRSRSGVVTVDVDVTRWAAAHATPTSLNIMGTITWAGSTIGVIAMAVVTTAYALRRWRRWSVALFFLFVLGGQLLVSNLVKILVERVRPDLSPFRGLAGPSFPSGHSTAAAAAWAAVALVLGRGTSPRARAALGGAAAAIAVAVACSRVFLGAHWTSDVIGGLILGWTWFGLCAVAFGGRVLRLGAPAIEAAPSAPASDEEQSSPHEEDRPQL
jgi:membrane-associated phospholipid phosphatase